MFEVKVITSDGLENLDMGNSSNMVITYEESDIAEMSIKGNGTNTVTIPRTSKNEQILSYVGNYMASTTPAYNSLRCIVINDGVQIMQGESKLYVLSSTSTAYRIAIVGEQCTLYDNLKALDLTSQENARLLGTWVVGRDLSTDAGIQYGADTDKDTVDENGYKIYGVPSFNLSTILNTVFSKIGYTLNNSQQIFGDMKVIPAKATPMPWYDNFPAAYNATPEDWGCYSVIRFRASDLTHQMTAVGTGTVIKYCASFPKSILGDASIIGVHYHMAVYGPIWKSGSVIECDGYAGCVRQSDGKVIPYASMGSFDKNDTWYADPLGRYIATGGRKDCKVRDVAIYGSNSINPGGNQIPWPAEYDTYFVGFKDMPCDNYYMTEYWIDILVKGNAKKPTYSAECSVANNLGWKTGLDMYKAALQMKARISRAGKTDADTYTINEVEAAKATARDWTEYLVETESDFHSDFCKHNRIKCQPSSDTGRTESYDLQIPDDKLEEDRDYISINVESPANSEGTIASFWQYKAQDDGTVYRDYIGAKHPFIINTATSKLLQATDLQGAYISQVEPYGIGNCIQSDYRRVTAKMRLPIVEILQFSHKVPIYLRQFGRYFYVSKIGEWEAGKLCNVELLQLSF